MRLTARDLTFTVSLADAPDAPRPVRLRVAGLIYAMTEAEAIELANHLADTIEQINHNERTATP